MKVLKWLGIVVGVYVVFVLLFESVFLGYYQPSFEDPEGCSSLGEDCGIPMILITTIDDKGQSTDRMVARFVSTDGKIYVSAHHWTRGWYKEAIKNPNVKGEIQGEVNYIDKVGTGYGWILILIGMAIFSVVFYIYLV